LVGKSQGLDKVIVVSDLQKNSEVVSGQLIVGVKAVVDLNPIVSVEAAVAPGVAAYPEFARLDDMAIAIETQYQAGIYGVFRTPEGKDAGNTDQQ